MIELPKALEKVREDLAEKYANGMAFPKIDWRNGFNACYETCLKLGFIPKEDVVTRAMNGEITAGNPSDSDCATTRIGD